MKTQWSIGVAYDYCAYHVIPITDDKNQEVAIVKDCMFVPAGGPSQVRRDVSLIESRARLIAAAPELYEACAWALKFAETAPSINLERYGGFFPERFFEVLRAALAKAEGREVEG